MKLIPVLALLALSSAAVAADNKKKPPAPTAAQTAAREAYAEGAALYRSGQYDEAIEAFKRAHAADPHPAFLFNIAQAYEKKGDLDQALEAYRAYLAAAPDASDRPTVEAAISSLVQRIAEANIQELRIRSLPDKADVELNGTPSGQTPVTLRVPVGKHDVLLKLAGHELALRQVNVTRASAVELDVTLKPLAKPQKVWTWVAVGTAAALALGGGAVGYLALQDAERLKASIKEPPVPNDLARGAESKALAANVLYGAAGAALIAGGALFFVEGSF